MSKMTDSQIDDIAACVGIVLFVGGLLALCVTPFGFWLAFLGAIVIAGANA